MSLATINKVQEMQRRCRFSVGPNIDPTIVSAFIAVSLPQYNHTTGRYQEARLLVTFGNQAKAGFGYLVSVKKGVRPNDQNPRQKNSFSKNLRYFRLRAAIKPSVLVTWKRNASPQVSDSTTELEILRCSTIHEARTAQDCFKHGYA